MVQQLIISTIGKRACLLIGIVFCAVQSEAQNVNYSQYKDVPFFTNPALVAAGNDIGASVIHRSQPLTETLKYNTTSAMFYMPLLDAKKPRRWGGWGLSLLNDEVKGGIDFRTQGISAAYAYNLPVAPRQFISFGMQAGYFQRNISTQGLATSNQWVENVGFVSSMGTGETLVDGRKNYLSLSSGLLYYMEDENQRHIAKFGLSVFNVNQPNVSLTEEKDVIPMKILAHGALALMKGDNVLIHGEMLYFHENSKNTYHVGTRASYYFDDRHPLEGSIDVKAGYRVNNAITAELQFHQPNFSVGFAYDFGIVSKESYRSPNDVPEVMFTLKKFIGTKKKGQVKRNTPYTTMGKVRDFYQNESQNQSSQHESGTKEGKPVRNDSLAIPEEGFRLKHDFKFGFNEATLNEESKAYLDDMIVLLNGNDLVRLEVIGHTDNVGSPSANKNVSMQRAQIVMDYLIEKGVDPDKLKATGMADKKPLVRNESESGRALNRRVEFVIYNR